MPQELKVKSGERLGMTGFLRLINGPVTLLPGVRETSIIGKGAVIIKRHRYLER